MGSLSASWITRIFQIDQLIVGSIDKENMNELNVLLDERDKLITLLTQSNERLDPVVLERLADETRTIIGKIQTSMDKYENALQYVIHSANAQKAYNISMALHN